MASDNEVPDKDSPYLSYLDIVLLLVFVLVLLLIIRKFRRRARGENGRFTKRLSINPVIKQISSPNFSSSLSVSGNFLDKMKTRKKRVIVFYGSQTGTGEEFANRLAKDSSRLGLAAMTFDPEDCTDWDDLARVGQEIDGSLVIFVMATYGEGDPTDNAQEFFDWLKETNDSLQGLKYTVFGLGNKTYEHYNEMGRYVDQRLEELGGERIYVRGEGDDDANIEEDFITWKEGLWPEVMQYFKIDSSQATAVGREYEFTKHSDLSTDEVFTGEPHRLGSYRNQKVPYNTKNPFLAPLPVIRELHKGGDRSCMHIELDTTGSKLSYVAGDHVAIYPVNDPQQVERVGELLSVDLDTVFTLANVDPEATKPHPFPCPTSYRTALSHYVDISAPPRTHVLRELAEFASDPKEREFLLDITSPSVEGKAQYSQWVVKAQRSIVAVLEDLSSFRPPLDYLLELLPRLQARYYSISSSPKLHPNSVHITAVLVSYQTSTGRTKRGVATSWFARLKDVSPEKRKVPIYIRHSSLRLPFRPVNPVIMVGPGTGLAPFRGFIQDRSTAINENKKLGATVLFFGCRNRNHDYLYQEELEEYERNGVLSGLYVAFSREQEEKVYVQHKLKEKGKEVWELIEGQGFFYVCGDARNMARDVQSTLLSVVKEYGGKTETEAMEYIKKLQKRGRYLQDVWS